VNDESIWLEGGTEGDWLEGRQDAEIERFPYDQIEAWIAKQLPGWRWVDAVPSGMDTKAGALCCKVEGQVGPTEWERRYIWLFPDGSIQPQADAG
jgi:hypothetical protein